MKGAGDAIPPGGPGRGFGAGGSGPGGPRAQPPPVLAAAAGMGGFGGVGGGFGGGGAHNTSATSTVTFTPSPLSHADARSPFQPKPVAAPVVRSASGASAGTIASGPHTVPTRLGPGRSWASGGGGGGGGGSTAAVFGGPSSGACDAAGVASSSAGFEDDVFAKQPPRLSAVASSSSSSASPYRAVAPVPVSAAAPVGAADAEGAPRPLQKLMGIMSDVFTATEVQRKESGLKATQFEERQRELQGLIVRLGATDGKDGGEPVDDAESPAAGGGRLAKKCHALATELVSTVQRSEVLQSQVAETEHLLRAKSEEAEARGVENTRLRHEILGLKKRLSSGGGDTAEKSRAVAGAADAAAAAAASSSPPRLPPPPRQQGRRSDMFVTASALIVEETATAAAAAAQPPPPLPPQSRGAVFPPSRHGGLAGGGGSPPRRRPADVEAELEGERTLRLAAEDELSVAKGRLAEAVTRESRQHLERAAAAAAAAAAASAASPTRVPIDCVIEHILRSGPVVGGEAVVADAAAASVAMTAGFSALLYEESLQRAEAVLEHAMDWKLRCRQVSTRLVGAVARTKSVEEERDFLLASLEELEKASSSTATVAAAAAAAAAEGGGGGSVSPQAQKRLYTQAAVDALKAEWGAKIADLEQTLHQYIASARAGSASPQQQGVVPELEARLLQANSARLELQDRVVVLETRLAAALADDEDEGAAAAAASFRVQRVELSERVAELEMENAELACVKEEADIACEEARQRIAGLETSRDAWWRECGTIIRDLAARKKETSDALAGLAALQGEVQALRSENQALRLNGSAVSVGGASGVLASPVPVPSPPPQMVGGAAAAEAAAAEARVEVAQLHAENARLQKLLQLALEEKEDEVEARRRVAAAAAAAAAAEESAEAVRQRQKEQPRRTPARSPKAAAAAAAGGDATPKSFKRELAVAKKPGLPAEVGRAAAAEKLKKKRLEHRQREALQETTPQVCCRFLLLLYFSSKFSSKLQRRKHVKFYVISHHSTQQSRVFDVDRAAAHRAGARGAASHRVSHSAASAASPPILEAGAPLGDLESVSVLVCRTIARGTHSAGKEGGG